MGTLFSGIYAEGVDTPLIPACKLEIFRPEEMVFLVTEVGHPLYNTRISLSVMEFEKSHPFISWSYYY